MTSKSYIGTDHRHNPAGNSMSSGPFQTADGETYFASYSTCRDCRAKIIRLTAIGETGAGNRRSWISLDDLEDAYAENEEIEGVRTMTQDDLKAILSQQEEHIRRYRSCAGRPDDGGPTLPDPIPGQAHSFGQYAAAPGVFYRACISCHVTETDDDYKIKVVQ